MFPRLPSLSPTLNTESQWFFWGFSLAFSDTANKFIGDLRENRLVALCKPMNSCVNLGYFGLMGVLEKPSIGSPRVPSIVFCVYQLMFAAITYASIYSISNVFGPLNFYLAPCLPLVL